MNQVLPATGAVLAFLALVISILLTIKDSRPKIRDVSELTTNDEPKPSPLFVFLQKIVSRIVAVKLPGVDVRLEHSTRLEEAERDVKLLREDTETMKNTLQRTNVLLAQLYTSSLTVSKPIYEEPSSAVFGFGAEPMNRGAFEGTDRNLFDGEDLDVPTYLRKGVRIAF